MSCERLASFGPQGFYVSSSIYSALPLCSKWLFEEQPDRPEYCRKWGQPSARPLGRNSVGKTSKKFIFCMYKKLFYPLPSSVIICLLSNPVLKFHLINHFFAASFLECSTLHGGCNGRKLNSVKWAINKVLL